MVFIHLIDENGNPLKQFGSRPLTFGMEKALNRYQNDTMLMGAEAALLSDIDKAGENPEMLGKAKGVFESLSALKEKKTELILRAFGNQITLDDLDNFVTREEAARVFDALVGESEGIIQKNV